MLLKISSYFVIFLMRHYKIGNHWVGLTKCRQRFDKCISRASICSRHSLINDWLRLGLALILIGKTKKMIMHISILAFYKIPTILKSMLTWCLWFIMKSYICLLPLEIYLILAVKLLFHDMNNLLVHLYYLG